MTPQDAKRITEALHSHRVEAIPGLEVIELPSNEGMMMFALAKRIQDLETATSWMKTQPGDLT